MSKRSSAGPLPDYIISLAEMVTAVMSRPDQQFSEETAHLEHHAAARVARAAAEASGFLAEFEAYVLSPRSSKELTKAERAALESSVPEVGALRKGNWRNEVLKRWTRMRRDAALQKILIAAYRADLVLRGEKPSNPNWSGISDIPRSEFTARYKLAGDYDPDAIMRCAGQGEFYTDEKTGMTHVREADWINVRADREAFEGWSSTQTTPSVLVSAKPKLTGAAIAVVRDFPSPRAPQAQVQAWYAARWTSRAQAGHFAPSRADDYVALKAEFNGRATRAMLDIERAKHPELGKSGRARKPTT